MIVSNLPACAMEELADGRTLCRAVGVTFEGRRNRIRMLQPGQELILRKYLMDGYSAYGIGIFDPTDCGSPGSSLGFIGREFKYHRVFGPIRRGSEMQARVHRVYWGRCGPCGFEVEIFNDSSSSTSYNPALDDTLCEIVRRNRS
jgi:hypothetical protein